MPGYLSSRKATSPICSTWPGSPRKWEKWPGSSRTKAGRNPNPVRTRGDLGLELADVLFVLICMANRDRIDLEEKFEQVLEKYRIRDSERWTKKSS